MKFLNMRARAGEPTTIEVPDEHVVKVRWVTETKNGFTRVTHAFQALFEGQKFSKFTSKAEFDNAPHPESAPLPKQQAPQQQQ